MSFFTTLKYYRPRKPPLVAGDDLAVVVARLAATGKLTGSGTYGVKIKFGEAIDADDKGTIWYESVLPNLMRVGEIEWDLNPGTLRSIDEVIGALKGNTSPVYRAHVFMGTPTADVLEPITREDSPENNIHFLPSDFSLELGPVSAGLLSTEDTVQVGWMSLNLGGSGYLYPWSLSEVLERASSSAAIKALTDVVQAMWPVPSVAPEKEIVEIRRQLPDIWPYEAERAWDWYWGVHESG
jgi:hypothetical protein